MTLCLLTGRPITRRRIRHGLQTRPIPLLGLIYCRRLNMRRSATGWTAAYLVGSWRRYIFLLYQQYASGVVVSGVALRPMQRWCCLFLLAYFTQLDRLVNKIVEICCYYMRSSCRIISCCTYKSWSYSRTLPVIFNAVFPEKYIRVVDNFKKIRFDIVLVICCQRLPWYFCCYQSYDCETRYYFCLDTV